MEKGKFGIKISFYTVLAFVLTALGGYTTVIFLLAGVMLLAEKNEWGIRQMIQAVFLNLIWGVVLSVLGLFDFIYDIPLVGAAWGVIYSVIAGLFHIAIYVFCILAIIRNAKGRDAAIPGAAKLADWAYGIVRQKAPVQYAAPGQPVQYVAPGQPVQYAAPGQPVQYAAPGQQAAPVQPGQPVQYAAPGQQAAPVQPGQQTTPVQPGEKTEQ